MPSGCRRRWLPAFGAWLVLCLLLAVMRPASAQLTFPGASPISAGNVVVRTQPELTDSTDGVRSILDKNIAIYGASPDVAFILQNTSFIANSADVTTPGGHTYQATAAGLGDTLLEARYTVYQVDGIGSTFRIAPYIGVSMPTGMDNVNADIGRAAQPGSGTWGSRNALTVTWAQLHWNGGAEVGYQANSADSGYRFGNTFYADAAFHYLLWPTDLENGVPAAEVYASLEANWTNQSANRAAGMNQYGTGGQLLTLDPGLIYTRRLYSLAFTALLPAYEHVRDNGSRLNYGGIFFFRYSLFTPYHW